MQNQSMEILPKNVQDIIRNYPITDTTHTAILLKGIKDNKG